MNAGGSFILNLREALREHTGLPHSDSEDEDDAGYYTADEGESGVGCEEEGTRTSGVARER